MSSASPYCPEYAPFFGFLGAALALVFGNMGAAYGTWKSALGLSTIAKLPRHKVQTEMVMKSIMPVILSGVCGIFGLIIAVIISSGMRLPTGAGQTTYSLYTGYAHLGAGLTVGLSNLASGLAIGMCGNCGVQDSCRQPKLYIGMVLIWSFGSALGLYGLIVALIIATKDASELCELH
jgi:V-type H+-transporting ATPase proteolipid subunit